MTERMAGKVALVSGGARGMGAAHVREMIAEGARVVAGDTVSYTHLTLPTIYSV